MICCAVYVPQAAGLGENGLEIDKNSSEHEKGMVSCGKILLSKFYAE